MTIGERIHKRRKELKLTMQTIFERENIKTGNLSELEHDKYLPSVQTLISLSRVLNCSIDWLLTGENYNSDSLISQPADVLQSEDSSSCSVTLTDAEADLINMYRLLPDSRREDAFDFIYTMYQKHVERKRDSIYWTYKEDKLKRKGDVDSDGNSQGGIA